VKQVDSGIVGVLLAAGSARRFGSDKLLFPVRNATPMALASARNLQAALERVVAVVRPGHVSLKQLFEAQSLETVVCSDADEGIGRSLACAVSTTSDAKGWLVALADMPIIQPESIRGVAAALERGAALAAPFYWGRRGHPVGFSARFREALLGLSGDEGARSVLFANSKLLERVDCDDPGVVADIDLPADLERLP
jgi:molybdenum cofactor cytidylyltransferase